MHCCWPNGALSCHPTLHHNTDDGHKVLSLKMPGCWPHGHRLEGKGREGNERPADCPICAHSQTLHLIGTVLALKCTWRNKLPTYAQRCDPKLEKAPNWVSKWSTWSVGGAPEMEPKLKKTACSGAYISMSMQELAGSGPQLTPSANLVYKCQLEKQTSPNAEFRSVNFYEGSLHPLWWLMSVCHQAFALLGKGNILELRLDWTFHAEP
eukprot:1144067-Pelagomonas_calceolata.AAC.2